MATVINFVVAIAVISVETIVIVDSKDGNVKDIFIIVGINIIYDDRVDYYMNFRNWLGCLIFFAINLCKLSFFRSVSGLKKSISDFAECGMI